MTQQKTKIKDIAQMAGVSTGTVDRILHNRGRVSAASREAVEKVLSEVNYKFNLHASAISCRKSFKIVIVIPVASPGEYWGNVQDGINHALEEYSDIRLNCDFLHYNQYDVFSCRATYDSILIKEPDAVIIGPTFSQETCELCKHLDGRGIPYIFIDSIIEGTFPVATFTTDSRNSGYLLGKLLHLTSRPGSRAAIMRVRRTENSLVSSSYERRCGFKDYLLEHGLSPDVEEAYFSVLDPEGNEKMLLDFLDSHPDIGSLAIMNSRGYIIADILSKNHIDDVNVISFDLTSNNVRCLENGSILAVLHQHPEQQGFKAVQAMIRYLLYGQKENPVNVILTIDIIMRENIPLIRDELENC